MKGKDRCKLLKELRQQIALSNNIDLITSECQYQGECKGTCPKCEAELRYLEQELDKKQKLGQKIVIAGLAATIAVSSTSCAFTKPTLTGDVASPYIEESSDQESESLDNITNDSNEYIELEGEVIELEGDVAYYDPDYEDDQTDE